MSDLDLNVLICIAKDKLPEVEIPSGTGWCLMCATELWISNTMLPMVTKGEANPVCIQCSVGLVELKKDTLYKLLPEQESELRELGILEASRQFVRRMNATSRKGI